MLLGSLYCSVKKGFIFFGASNESLEVLASAGLRFSTVRELFVRYRLLSRVSAEKLTCSVPNFVLSPLLGERLGFFANVTLLAAIAIF